MPDVKRPTTSSTQPQLKTDPRLPVLSPPSIVPHPYLSSASEHTVADAQGIGYLNQVALDTSLCADVWRCRDSSGASESVIVVFAAHTARVRWLDERCPAVPPDLVWPLSL